jgi:hypothetical protein
MQQQIANGNCIIVVPFYPIAPNVIFKQLNIDRLFFWHKGTFDHTVNEETLKFFLFHVQLFGATVYPDCPELGCIAINAPAEYNNGETGVNQIHYKGQVVYCRNR